MFKFRSLTLACALCVSISFFSSLTAGFDKQSIAPGNYELRITPPPEQELEEKIQSAVVKAVDGELVIETVDGVGNPGILRGIAKDTAIKFGVTDVEDDSLISLHFVGKVTSGSTADGTFSIFVDQEKVMAGKWTLNKKPADH